MSGLLELFLVTKLYLFYITSLIAFYVTFWFKLSCVQQYFQQYFQYVLIHIMSSKTTRNNKITGLLELFFFTKLYLFFKKKLITFYVTFCL